MRGEGNIGTCTVGRAKGSLGIYLLYSTHIISVVAPYRKTLNPHNFTCFLVKASGVFRPEQAKATTCSLCREVTAAFSSSALITLCVQALGKGGEKRYGCLCLHAIRRRRRRRRQRIMSGGED